MAQAQSQPARPPVPLLEEDVEYWFRQFGGESAFEKLLQEETTKQPSQTPDQRESHDKEPRRDDLDVPGGSYNPFPPGYAEDLEE